MPDTIRWGIVGTGSIARQFARGLSVLPDAALVAVASRAQDTADRFGDEFNVRYRHASYAGLAENDEVDAVYIATPHPMHKDNTLLCLEGGKAVLCEKPFAINAIEAVEMIDCAREKGLFLMEAMWTHFFPAMAKVRELIAAGAIGEVRLVQANFGFRAGLNPDGRLFAPALGGGALLDVGIYNIAFARMVFKRDPVRITSQAHLGETGVDEQSAVTLGYENGALAVLTCAVRTTTTHDAAIYGTDGYIRIPHMYWQPVQLILKTGDNPEETLHFDKVGNGYNYEAVEFANCLRRGALESAVVPLSTTLANMRLMDTIRAQWGLKYPVE